VLAVSLCPATAVRGATGRGLLDQTWDACTTFAYAPDACDCDTGDPDVCCMGQEFSPAASVLNGFDLYLRGSPDADPNAPFDTFVTANVRMRTIRGPLMGSATAPLALPTAASGAWVHFALPSPLVLAPGIVYVLEVRASPERVMWFGSSASSCGGGYPGGSELALVDPGCCDFNFRTYGGFVAGGGSPRVDCAHEWLTEPAPPFTDQGVARNRLECTDGDPACDFGVAGDGACTFHVAECFDVADPVLPCTPTGVSAVKLFGGGRSTDATNRRALEDVLVAQGGMPSGRCRNPGPAHGATCAHDADCDSAPGAGDGRCDARLVTFVPPTAAGDACTDFASVTVPLRTLPGGGMAPGRRTLRIAARPEGAPIDGDSLTLVCDPNP
jgi:hypothetical protein